MTETASNSAICDGETCADRLKQIAARPEYVAIKWELLHASDELNAMRELLIHSIDSIELKAFDLWVATKFLESGIA